MRISSKKKLKNKGKHQEVGNTKENRYEEKIKRVMGIRQKRNSKKKEE